MVRQAGADDSARANAHAMQRLNSDQQSDTAAPPRVIVEVGAGTGAFTPLFLGLADTSDRYIATDIGENDERSPYFAELRDPQDARRSHMPGVEIVDHVDANALGRHFQANSVDQIVGANAYGNIDAEGESYGLMASTGNAKAPFRLDTRFASAAHEVLKPGGQIRLFARCNTLHPFLKKDKNIFHPRIPEKQVNRFMDIPAEQLQNIADLGFNVDVFRANQPFHIEGRRPDTHAGSITQSGEGRKVLGQYNTEFLLTKTDDGQPGQVTLHKEFDATAEEVAQSYDEKIDSLTRNINASDDESDASGNSFEDELQAELDRALLGGLKL